MRMVDDMLKDCQEDVSPHHLKLMICYVGLGGMRNHTRVFVFCLYDLQNMIVELRTNHALRVATKE